VAEGEVPKCDSTYSLDIPNSQTLWEADPRPERSAEVGSSSNNTVFAKI
jgi:hypothetical protein